MSCPPLDDDITGFLVAFDVLEVAAGVFVSLKSVFSAHPANATVANASRATTPIL
jgi:hypothetical protein